MTTESVARDIIKAGALDIRDIDGGEDPFLYASGNWGPGYVSIKGLISNTRLFNRLVTDLHMMLNGASVEFDFVAGNVTGGMIPGWILSVLRSVPFVYIRGARKKGGQKELITGIEGLPPRSSGVVVEELVNFAQTSCNSATALRELGHPVKDIATILYYGNPNADDLLESHSLSITYVLTLEDLLETARNSQAFSGRLINDYKVFLADPLDWQKRRGFEPVAEGGTQ